MPEVTSFAVPDALDPVLSPAPPTEQNPALVYLSSLAPGSRRTMTEALAEIAALLVRSSASLPPLDRIALLPWRAIRYAHTTALRAVLEGQHGFATTNKILSALRGTLKTAWRLGLMTAEEYRRAADVPSVSGETVPAGRSLTPAEIGALFAVCRADTRPTGARDAAIIALLYGCGLRRAELAGLTLADWRSDEDGSGNLVVRGKRNRQRLVPVVGGVARSLRAWLAVRGDAPGAVFVRIVKGGHLTNDFGRGVTPDAVYLLLRGRAQTAGLAHFSPHDFRRTFVGDLLDRGADIATVQKLAGHASVTTTARYDRRGERVKRQAAELLTVPF